MKIDARAFVREEEVIEMNAMLAEKQDFIVEDINNLPEGIRAELIDCRIFYFAIPMDDSSGITGGIVQSILQLYQGERWYL